MLGETPVETFREIIRSLTDERDRARYWAEEYRDKYAWQKQYREAETGTTSLLDTSLHDAIVSAGRFSWEEG